jgi:hypothetical protein
MSEPLKLGGFKCYLVVDIFEREAMSSVQVSYQTVISTAYSTLSICALVTDLTTDTKIVISKHLYTRGCMSIRYSFWLTSDIEVRSSGNVCPQATTGHNLGMCCRHKEAGMTGKCL